LEDGRVLVGASHIKQLLSSQAQEMDRLVAVVEHLLLENQEQIVTSQERQRSMAQVERVLLQRRALQVLQIQVMEVAQVQVLVEQVDLVLQYCALLRNL
jgi:hypothetical protein